jgi:hypothetical protein
VEQADSTKRRYHVSALAKAIPCLQAFISQRAGFTRSQISRRLNVNPTTASRACGNVIDPGSRQQDSRKRCHRATHPGNRAVAAKSLPLPASHYGREHSGRRAAKIPLGRAGLTTEVAATIRFPASPAASYIPRATLDVNGDLCMGSGKPGHTVA